MDENIQMFNVFLEKTFPRLKDIMHTFKECSKYEGNQFLVSSKIRTINFDKLVEWYRKPKPKSADSLSFSEKCLYFIEFKAGDPTKHERKQDILINSVAGKINDSDKVLSAMYLEAFGEEIIRPNQKFCLVVDSKIMGITPIVSVLAKLSLKNNLSTSYKERMLFEKVQPSLEDKVEDPDHYSAIEIWYSEFFEIYLQMEQIKSSEIFLREYEKRNIAEG